VDCGVGQGFFQGVQIIAGDVGHQQRQFAELRQVGQSQVAAGRRFDTRPSVASTSSDTGETPTRRKRRNVCQPSSGRSEHSATPMHQPATIHANHGRRSSAARSDQRGASGPTVGTIRGSSGNGFEAPTGLRASGNGLFKGRPHQHPAQPLDDHR
jgi:hypothetical protein